MLSAAGSRTMTHRLGWNSQKIAGKFPWDLQKRPKEEYNSIKNVEVPRTIIPHGRKDLLSLLPGQGTECGHIIREYCPIAAKSHSCPTTHMLDAWTTNWGLRWVTLLALDTCNQHHMKRNRNIFNEKSEVKETNKPIENINTALKRFIMISLNSRASLSFWNTFDENKSPSLFVHNVWGWQNSPWAKISLGLSCDRVSLWV